MKKGKIRLIFFSILAAWVITACAAPIRSETFALNGPKVVLKAARNDGRLVRIPPPEALGGRQAAASFTIRYLNAGEVNGFGDTCIGWPEEAKAAFSYAANIWGGLLQSTVPISINACWANLTPADTLGHGGASKFLRDFSGAPVASTFYPVSLANALAASDLYPSQEKIIIAYNAQQPWYFGTDGNCPAGKYDFVSVIMHEICHGLGFLGSWSYENGQGAWGGIESTPGVPLAYDRFIANGSVQALLNTALFPNPSSALGAQLTGNNLFFYGANAVAANGGTAPAIYAPSTWSDGSSACHLGENYRATTNGLMVYSLADGYSIHHPGPVTLGLLKDVGWSAGTQLVPEPAVMVNGSTNDLVLTTADAVNVSISLNPRDSSGVNKDWWMIAVTTVGIYYFQATGEWLQAADLSQVRPAHQGPLFNLPATTVLAMPGLPPADYRFYFGVDAMNGVIDPDVVYATVRTLVQ
ncbi:MAG: hypothetical protein WC299_05860 [Kiritimatiellia bacterium]